MGDYTFTWVSIFKILTNYEETHSDILCPNPSENTAYTFVYLFLFQVTLLGFYIRPNTSTHPLYLT